MFDLTPTGQAALADDPLSDLIDALEEFDIGEQAKLLSALTQLASTLANRRGERAFGTCRDCSHFTPEGQSGYCACMAANLMSDEIDQLCASFHSPADPETVQTEGIRK